jgi:hypothetical protein
MVLILRLPITHGKPLNSNVVYCINFVTPSTTFILQIVDFCCGANDFSRLMKEKLDHVQKKCCFRNYDLIQPQVKLKTFESLSLLKFNFL